MKQSIFISRNNIPAARKMQELILGFTLDPGMISARPTSGVEKKVFVFRRPAKWMQKERLSVRPQ